jgi:formylglycine-generating enzyme required for sulfatase activity
VRPARLLDVEVSTERPWEEARRRISRNQVYGRISLKSIPELLPLGADPKSGLEEFLHLASHEGRLPVRDAAGALTTTTATGIVFVLIPGADAGEDGAKEGPAIQPYLLAKHEMTQAQWLRLAGSRPSAYGPSANFNRHQHTPRHPVETVTLAACEDLVRFGLAVPTVEQWMHGARGGTRTPWPSGEAADSLLGHANLADTQYRRMYNAKPGESWDDGYIMHAPVGTYLPNPFGLHDVIGNVSEWCKTADGFCVMGGSFASLAADATLETRQAATADRRSSETGVRPVMPLP